MDSRWIFRQKLKYKDSVPYVSKVSGRCQGPNQVHHYLERDIHIDIQNNTWKTVTGGLAEEKPHHDEGYGLPATPQAHKTQEITRLIPDLMIRRRPLIS